MDSRAWSSKTFSSRKVPEFMHYRLVRCINCDVIYADPAPDARDLEDVYRRAAYDSKDEAVLASRTYGRLLDRCLGRLPDRDAAVDIGTGDGSFLGELISRGFQNVEGIEPSVAPRMAADPEIRPLIRQAVFAAGLFPAESQTLVTCFQTLEHVPEPLAVAREAYRILKPGGIFMVVAHNHRSLSSRVLGSGSPIYDVEHLQLFSPRSLTCLMRRAGFQSPEVHPITNRYHLRYWAQVVPWPPRVRKPAMRLIEAAGIGRLVVPIRAGNLVGLGYKPL
ncbi:MAG TPA: class I SAM-dependent methyltransferase [Candidatus Binatia bacterium]|nr:class I SAM-dependent methyltransferase [Candidatus Binatia bacterium]